MECSDTNFLWSKYRIGSLWYREGFRRKLLKKNNLRSTLQLLSIWQIVKYKRETHIYIYTKYVFFIPKKVREEGKSQLKGDQSPQYKGDCMCEIGICGWIILTKVIERQNRMIFLWIEGTTELLRRDDTLLNTSDRKLFFLDVRQSLDCH